MSANQSKGPEKFSNLGRIYREVQELRLQVRQAESVRGFEETPLTQRCGLVRERLVRPSRSSDRPISQVGRTICRILELAQVRARGKGRWFTQAWAIAP